MKAGLVKILIGVVLYVFTFGVLPNWVGDVFTVDAGAPAQGTAISVPAGTRFSFDSRKPSARPINVPALALPAGWRLT